LQDLADDETSIGDDEIAIIDTDPSARSTDNIITLINNYNIDDNAAEHIYDGSIIQNGGDDIYDGIINIGNSDVNIQIIQNGAILSDDWWNFGGGGLNADSANGISHKFMIKVRTAGADIDGRRLLGMSKVFGKTYSEFRINGTTRGNNVLAISNSDDLNNATAAGTVATWTTITNLNEGYIELDVDNDGNGEPYFSEWTKATYTINQMYERLKWLTRQGTSETLYGLNGELFRGVTHEIPIDNPTGDFDPYEPVSWAGGTGQMLAINSETAGTKIWIQLLTGVIPTDGQTITGGNSGGTADVDGAVSEKTVCSPFIGQSTGSAIITPCGNGIKVLDLSASDKLTDLDGVLRIPPNYVTFTVSGLVAGEDRVLVTPWDGSTLDPEGNPAIDKDQLSLNTTLNGAAETAVVTTTAIPVDTPETGTIRIELDDGNEIRVEYTSYTGSTYTIVSTDFSTINATAGNNVYNSYIDDLAAGTSIAFTTIYNIDRNLVVLCRDGGVTPIKQFISPSVLGSAGGSVSVIRTSDL
jgi:hypothetical protein